jgi:hypothetical protein
MFIKRISTVLIGLFVFAVTPIVIGPAVAAQKSPVGSLCKKLEFAKLSPGSKGNG